MFGTNKKQQLLLIVTLIGMFLCQNLTMPTTCFGLGPHSPFDREESHTEPFDPIVIEDVDILESLVLYQEMAQEIEKIISDLEISDAIDSLRNWNEDEEGAIDSGLDLLKQVYAKTSIANKKIYRFLEIYEGIYIISRGFDGKLGKRTMAYDLTDKWTKLNGLAFDVVDEEDGFCVLAPEGLPSIVPRIIRGVINGYDGYMSILEHIKNATGTSEFYNIEGNRYKATYSFLEIVREHISGRPLSAVQDYLDSRRSFLERERRLSPDLTTSL